MEQTESPEITHTDAVSGSLTKEHVEQRESPANGAGTLVSHMENNKCSHRLSALYHNELPMEPRPTCKTQNVKLLEGNIRESLGDLGYCVTSPKAGS